MLMIGMAAAGCIVQEPYPRQPPGDYQPPRTEPVNVAADLSAGPESYAGKCPVLITFKGTIRVNRPTTVKYRFIRSDNADGPVQTLTFRRAGTQKVKTTWQLGGPARDDYKGWEAIDILSPVAVRSNRAYFEVRCGVDGPRGDRPYKRLPDLVVTDITLDRKCRVVVHVKNNGPGRVPAKAWEENGPNASVLYININGKKWEGGQTLREFDPDRNLRHPGGTAVMTSNLSIPNKAKVGAFIDFSNKIVEEDERNNLLKTVQVCETIDRPPPHGDDRPQRRLPDLVIEDIKLDRHCNVVVRVKNIGSGPVPDAVWTSHTPNSSSVFLYINGRKWGGQTLWKFDARRHLQRPGGTAVMTSNLKVPNKVVITALIDHTREVVEENDNNNVMKKVLDCESAGAERP